MPQWAIAAIILALVAGIGAGAVHTYNGALAREAKALKDLDTEKQNSRTLGLALSDQRVEVARLQATAAVMDKIQAKRGVANVTAAQIEGIINAQLAKLNAASPEVRTWSLTPVPPSVLAVVRNEAGGVDRAGGDKGSPGSAAERVDRANPGTGVAGSDDKRRAFGLRPPEPRAPATVQR